MLVCLTEPGQCLQGAQEDLQDNRASFPDSPRLGSRPTNGQVEPENQKGGSYYPSLLSGLWSKIH